MNEYVKQAEDFLKETNTEFITEFVEFGSMDWDDKNTKRNIFSVTLKNSKGEYKLRFGSSLNDSCEEVVGVNPDATYKLQAAYTRMGTDVYFSLDVPGKDLISGDLDKYKEPAKQHMREVLERDYKSKIGKAKYAHVKNAVTLDYNKNLHWIENFPDEDFKRNCKNAYEKASKDKYFIGQAGDIKHPTAYDVLACLTKYDPGTFEDFCSEFGYDEDSRRAERTYNAVKEEWVGVQTLWTEDEIDKLWEIQ